MEGLARKIGRRRGQIAGARRLGRLDHQRRRTPVRPDAASLVRGEGRDLTADVVGRQTGEAGVLGPPLPGRQVAIAAGIAARLGLGDHGWKRAVLARPPVDGDGVVLDHRCAVTDLGPLQRPPGVPMRLGRGRRPPSRKGPVEARWRRSRQGRADKHQATQDRGGDESYSRHWSLPRPATAAALSLAS